MSFAPCKDKNLLLLSFAKGRRLWALGVKCDAFTIPPADREPPGRGRPPKPTTEEPAPNRLRGRPASDARPTDSGKRKGKGK
jgi:hypothetical protein